MSSHRFYVGDVLTVLKTMDSESVHCVVTSPPYWGLRDYGVPGQIGLEPTLNEYVVKMVDVFREVRRVLRPDGTLWLNLGDTYSTGGRAFGGKHVVPPGGVRTGWHSAQAGLKHKDLTGLPWRVAFALQDDGWYLRSDVIWAKSNPMPESVRDRPTRSHEYIFLLTKSQRYYYDWLGIAEPATSGDIDPPNGSLESLRRGKQCHHAGRRQKVPGGWDSGSGAHGNFHRAGREQNTNYNFNGLPVRNRRSVWTIPTQAFPQAHFATFPEALVEPCILTGSPQFTCPRCGTPWRRETRKERVGPVWNQRGDKLVVAEALGHNLQTGHERYRTRYETETYTEGFRPFCSCSDNDGSGAGVVLDPFGGSGTVTYIAMKHNRNSIYIDLNQAYVDIALDRCGFVTESPMDYHKCQVVRFGGSADGSVASETTC